MKKTNEEALQDQGMKQVNIYDVIYPDEKEVQEEKDNEKHISGSE